jgi:GTPase involved in cell partitioning and DNA repair
LLTCYSVFEELKKHDYNLWLNKLKAEQIYKTLKSSCDVFLKFYSRNQELKKYKLYYKWKNETLVKNKIENLKKEIQITLEKKVYEELHSLETKITEKEKENITLKGNLSKYMQMEAEYLKKIKQYEETENDYLAKIKRLEVRFYII